MISHPKYSLHLPTQIYSHNFVIFFSRRTSKMIWDSIFMKPGSGPPSIPFKGHILQVVTMSHLYIPRILHHPCVFPTLSLIPIGYSSLLLPYCINRLIPFEALELKVQIRTYGFMISSFSSKHIIHILSS